MSSASLTADNVICWQLQISKQMRVTVHYPELEALRKEWDQEGATWIKVRVVKAIWGGYLQVWIVELDLCQWLDRLRTWMKIDWCCISEANTWVKVTTLSKSHQTARICLSQLSMWSLLRACWLSCLNARLKKSSKSSTAITKRWRSLYK